MKKSKKIAALGIFVISVLVLSGIATFFIWKMCSPRVQKVDQIYTIPLESIVILEGDEFFQEEGISYHPVEAEKANEILNALNTEKIFCEYVEKHLKPRHEIRSYQTKKDSIQVFQMDDTKQYLIRIIKDIAFRAPCETDETITSVGIYIFLK